jgi:hypothetical protein
MIDIVTYLTKPLKLDPFKHNSKYLNHIQMVIKATNDSTFLNEFRLESIRIARKQTNFNLASHLLMEEMSSNTTGPANYLDSNLYETTKSFMGQLNEQSYINNISIVRLEKESAKLMRLLSTSEKDVNLDSIEILTNSISRHIQTMANNYLSSQMLNNADSFLTQSFSWSSSGTTSSQFKNKKQLLTNDMMSEIYARSILSLSKWLTFNQSLLKDLNTSYLNNNKKITSKDFDSSLPGFNNIDIIISNLNKILSVKNGNDFIELKEKFNLNDGRFYFKT